MHVYDEIRTWISLVGWRRFSSSEAWRAFLIGRGSGRATRAVACTNRHTAPRSSSPPLPRYSRAFSIPGTTPVTLRAVSGAKVWPRLASAGNTSASAMVAPAPQEYDLEGV
eukprot:9473942-Pyramimonas_sp.AAC.1